MSRTVPAALTTAVLAVAAVSTASTPARWAPLAVATVVFHFAYLLYVMLGALLGLRDVGGWACTRRGLGDRRTCHDQTVPGHPSGEGAVGEVRTHAVRRDVLLEHYVFGVILPESSQGLVYWAQAGLVVGVYVSRSAATC